MLLSTGFTCYVGGGHGADFSATVSGGAVVPQHVWITYGKPIACNVELGPPAPVLMRRRQGWNQAWTEPRAPGSGLDAESRSCSGITVT